MENWENFGNFHPPAWLAYTVLLSKYIGRKDAVLNPALIQGLSLWFLLICYLDTATGSYPYVGIHTLDDWGDMFGKTKNTVKEIFQYLAYHRLIKLVL